MRQRALHGLRRAICRGLDKVTIQAVLTAAVWNLKWLAQSKAHRLRRKRIGSKVTKVRVIYEGFFADIARRQHDEVAFHGETLAALHSRLTDLYGSSFQQAVQDTQSGEIAPGIAILINGVRADLDSPLAEGDEVVFLVSFAGG